MIKQKIINHIVTYLSFFRFGHIMSIISCRNIAKDEEILVSYNYELSGAPQWYKDLWQNHKRYYYLIDF